MKNALKPVWLAVALAVTLPSAAMANDWYGGVGYGVAIAHDLNDFSKVSADKSERAYSAFAGYNFHENLGAELGYLSAGDWDVDAKEFSNQGVTASIIGRLPFNETFSAFAEGGAYLYNVKSGNGDEDNVAPMAGLGLTAKLHDWVDLQARYRYFVSVGDDLDNGKIGSGTKRWVTDMSTATLELVIHPNRTKQAESEPAPAPVVVPPPAAPQATEQTYNLSSDVLFQFGKADLKPEGIAALNSLYQQIASAQSRPDHATVIGFSDRIGTDASNQALSEARARTVANHLVSQGMAADRVSIQGNGKNNPVTGSKCDSVKPRAALIDCLAPDRRVEVRVTGVQSVAK